MLSIGNCIIGDSSIFIIFLINVWYSLNKDFTEWKIDNVEEIESVFLTAWSINVEPTIRTTKGELRNNIFQNLTFKEMMFPQGLFDIYELNQKFFYKWLPYGSGAN